MRISTICVTAILLASTGCWFHGPGDLKRELSREAGVKLNRQIGLTFGPTSLMLARWGLRMADEQEFTLKGVRKVQVGVYEVDGLRRGHDAPARLEADLFPEWDPIVRIHDEGENVLVLLRHDDERIRAMLVAVTDHDEWVLVRIRGRLDRVVEDAMRMAFDEMDRPDLYDRSREERGLDDSDEEAGPEEGDAVTAVDLAAGW